jgi:hypothetical protein
MSMYVPFTSGMNSIARNTQEIDAHEQIRLVHIIEIARNGPHLRHAAEHFVKVLSYKSRWPYLKLYEHFP